MIVAVWVIAVTAVSLYALAACSSYDAAQAAAPVFVALVLITWALLAHHHDWSRRRDRTRR